jgi:hypothetical protein
MDMINIKVKKKDDIGRELEYVIKASEEDAQSILGPLMEDGAQIEIDEASAASMGLSDEFDSDIEDMEKNFITNIVIQMKAKFPRSMTKIDKHAFVENNLGKDLLEICLAGEIPKIVIS